MRVDERISIGELARYFLIVARYAVEVPEALLKTTWSWYVSVKV